MTAVEFHVNQSDKLNYTCRLLRKAYRAGANMVVTAEQNMLDALDQMLWQYASTEFLPHCSLQSPIHTQAATPIVLTTQLDKCRSSQVLVNLGQHVAPGFERFERVIEVASSQDEDLQAARARWKYYQERGYPLKRHEAAPVDARAA